MWSWQLRAICLWQMCLFIENGNQLFLKKRAKRNLENVSFPSVGFLGGRMRANPSLLKAVRLNERKNLSCHLFKKGLKSTYSRATSRGCFQKLGTVMWNFKLYMWHQVHWSNANSYASSCWIFQCCCSRASSPNISCFGLWFRSILLTSCNDYRSGLYQIKHLTPLNTPISELFVCFSYRPWSMVHGFHLHGQFLFSPLKLVRWIMCSKCTFLCTDYSEVYASWGAGACKANVWSWRDITLAHHVPLCFFCYLYWWTENMHPSLIARRKIYMPSVEDRSSHQSHKLNRRLSLVSVSLSGWDFL